MPLSKIIDRFEGRRIVVLGDFILDEFVFGDITRVSREAPVLILGHRHTEFRPGGAANAVANLASLGLTPLPVGCVGDDEWAEALCRVWPSDLDLSAVLRHDDLSTTRKSRILAGSVQSFRQQVVRIDYEAPVQLTPQREAELIGALDRHLPQAQALLISDYSLGVLTASVRRHAIESARQAGIPVVVDSRDDPAGFPGATVVTPNVSELERTLGMSLDDQRLLEEMGERCRRDWGLQALLVTRGKMGLSLFRESSALHVPVFGGDEVADVTGAGDTVASVLAASLAVGADLETAARLANCGGGIVVGKRGTATVSARELQTAAGTLEARRHGFD